MFEANFSSPCDGIFGDEFENAGLAHGEFAAKITKDNQRNDKDLVDIDLFCSEDPQINIHRSSGGHESW